MRARHWTPIVFLLAALAVAGEARANGRFPKAQQIVTVPGSLGRTIYLRATFGVLVSRDAGASWSWICEQAMGFSGTWDPPIAATRGGRLWIGLPDGLSSTQDGCDITRATELQGETVVDIAAEPDEQRVALVTSTPGKPSFVWRRSTVTGPFVRLGVGVLGVSFDTVDVAPSKPSRLYATAAPVGSGPRAHFFRSDDGGATLEEVPVHLEKDGRLFLSAIDPRDEKRLFLRHTNDLGTDLLLSIDSGTTWKSVLKTKTSMFGFAMSSDGTSLYAGAGMADEGIFRSRDRGVTWEAASKTSVLCLFAAGADVFACSNPYTRGGWAIAVSVDRAASFRPLAGWGDVQGPLGCEAGSAGHTCGGLWGEVRATVVSPPPSPSAEPVDATPADAAPTATPPPAKTRGCGCGASTLDERRGGSFGGGILLIVVAVAACRLDRARLTRARRRPAA
jgi:hypothetical protein